MKNKANCVKISSETMISSINTLVSREAPNRIKHVIMSPYPNSMANALYIFNMLFNGVNGE